MDDVTRHEAEELLRVERQKILEQSSRLSWFRMWLWLIVDQRARLLEAKRSAASGNRAVPIQHVARTVRLRRWLRSVCWLPVRAWCRYRFEQLSEAEKDVWLSRYIDRTLYLLGKHAAHVPGKIGFGSDHATAATVERCAFVDAIVQEEKAV